MTVLTLVRNNPYRIMGVYANSSTKDRVANKNRLSAFARVGKACSFPSDLSDILGSVDRSSGNLAWAEQQLNLDLDKLKHAFFWFVQASALDTAALSNLQSGDKEKALEILNKRETFSTLHNKAVLAYADQNLGTAIHYIAKLIHNDTYREEFVKAVCGETFQIGEEETAKLFIATLAEEIGWKRTYHLFDENGTCYEDDEYIAEKLVKEPISRLSALIDKQSNVKTHDELADACRILHDESQANLKLIDRILSEDDNQRRMIHDKVANRLCQLASKYYQESDSPEETEYQLSKKWLTYALDIAVGEMARNTVSEAIDGITEAHKFQMLASTMSPLMNAIDEFKKRRSHTLTSIKGFISYVKDYEIQVNMCSEIERESYVLLASAAANLALNEIIDIVNSAQKTHQLVVQGLKDGSLVNTITTARELNRVLTMMTVDSETRERMRKNLATINELSSQVETVQRHVNRQTSSGGCYIATMAYGDYDHPQVQELRHFRDHVLSKFGLGRAFIRFYYKHSPAWIVQYWNNRYLAKAVRTLLNIFVMGYKHVK